MDLKRGSLARTAGLGGPFLCGGRSGFAQGSVAADEETIRAFFRGV